MERILDFIMLIVFAFGSALIFTVAVLWKFVQAVYQIVTAKA